MDVVQALSDKSLLRTWVPTAQSRYDIEEPYFGMYLSIHEYAAEKLEASGQPASRLAEERHGRYFAGFGTDEAIEALSRHGGVKRRRALALELDNLVAACRRAVRRADGEIAVAAYRAIWEVLELQGPCALGIDLGSQVLAVDTLDAVAACRGTAGARHGVSPSGSQRGGGDGTRASARAFARHRRPASRSEHSRQSWQPPPRSGTDGRRADAS